MNCARVLGNKLSLLADVRRFTFPLFGCKQFSSLLGIPSIRDRFSLEGTNMNSVIKPNLSLMPVPSLILQKCGMKVKGKPKLRCKHCYYAGIEGVLHVFCDMYPRHKQRARQPSKKRYGWILTSASQSKYRPY